MRRPPQPGTILRLEVARLVPLVRGGHSLATAALAVFQVLRVLAAALDVRGNGWGETEVVKLDGEPMTAVGKFRGDL